jgi:hypothetical protein
MSVRMLEVRISKLVFCFLFACLGQAASAATVTGLVTGAASGAPVAGATIEFSY